MTGITSTIGGTVRVWSRDIWWTVRHSIASDAGLLAASQYIATGLSFLTAAVAARLLGPAEYGIASMVMAYPTLLWTFVAVKSMPVTTRYVSSFRVTRRFEDLKSICKLGYGLDLIASLAAFLLTSATSWWVAQRFLNIPEMVGLMVGYAASFPFWSFAGTSLTILSSWRKFRWLAIFQVLEKGLTSIIVLSLIWTGWGVAGMVLGTALGEAISGVLLIGAGTSVLYRDRVGVWWNAPFSNVAPLRKELTAFFGWNYVMATLSGVMGQVPLMLLGRMRGPEEAGFYRLATNLATVGSYLESSLGRVVYPELSARWNTTEQKSLNKTLKSWTIRAGLPIGVLVLFTTLFLPFLVPLLFGPDYSLMVPGTQTMMVGAAVSAVFFWLHSFYYASGRIGIWTKAYSLYTAFIVGLAWFCIRWWGFSGLASLVAVGKVFFTVSMVFVFLTAREKSQ